MQPVTRSEPLSTLARGMCKIGIVEGTEQTILILNFEFKKQKDTPFPVSAQQCFRNGKNHCSGPILHVKVLQQLSADHHARVQRRSQEAHSKTKSSKW